MALQRTILIILKGYPRLSETFIAQEIRALEQRGLKLRLASLRRPTDKAVHPVNREIKAPVSYLPEYLYQRAVAGVARLVAGAALAALSRGAADLAQGPQA